MHCLTCGAKLETGPRFCPECGFPQMELESQARLDQQEQIKRKGAIGRWLVVGVTFLLVSGAVGVFLFQQRAQEEAQAQLESAAEEAFASYAIEVDDYFGRRATGCVSLFSNEGIEFDAVYLTIDAKGNGDSNGARDEALDCILGRTVPAGVLNRISQTTALQGLLEDNWEVLEGKAEVEAKWSYHPANGLNMSMKIVSKYQAAFDFEEHYKLVVDHWRVQNLLTD